MTSSLKLVRFLFPIQLFVTLTAAEINNQDTDTVQKRCIDVCGPGLGALIINHRGGHGEPHFDMGNNASHLAYCDCSNGCGSSSPLHENEEPPHPLEHQCAVTCALYSNLPGWKLCDGDDVNSGSVPQSKEEKPLVCACTETLAIAKKSSASTGAGPGPGDDNTQCSSKMKEACENICNGHGTCVPSSRQKQKDFDHYCDCINSHPKKEKDSQFSCISSSSSSPVQGTGVNLRRRRQMKDCVAQCTEIRGGHHFCLPNSRGRRNHMPKFVCTCCAT